jgi:hypothetical protein
VASVMALMLSIIAGMLLKVGTLANRVGPD